MKRISLRSLALVLVLPYFSGCQTNEPPIPPPPAPVYYTLSVLVAGGGTVTSSPAGIAACDQLGNGVCKFNFVANQVVTLTATAVGNNNLFGSWTGCTPVVQSDPTKGVCTITMTGSAAVAAKFITQISLAGLGNTFVLTQDDPSAIPPTRAHILSFDRSTPGTVVSDKVITNLGTDSIVAIDFRPSNSQLYGLGVENCTTPPCAGSLYVIDPSSGAANKVEILNGVTFDPAPGAKYDIAFEPGSGAEYVWVLEDSGSSSNSDGKGFRIDPSGNVGATGFKVPGSRPVGIGFTNAFRGAQAYTPYVLDSASTKLQTITLPADGKADATLTPGSTLGTAIPRANGFVINGIDGKAYAAFGSGTGATFATVTLSTGAVTSQQIGTTLVIAGLAIPEPQEPVAYGICETTAENANGNAVRFPSNWNCNSGKSFYSFKASDPSNTVSYIGELNVGGVPITFNGVALTTKPPTGVPSAPGGELYLLGDDNKVYQVNPLNGAVTNGVIVTGLNLTNVSLTGFDFDPTILTGQSLRITGGTVDGGTATVKTFNAMVDPTNGSTTPFGAGTLSQSPFKITAVAFDNNTQTPPQSSMYWGIDSASNRLFTIDSSTSDPTKNPGRLTFQANLGAGSTSNLSGFAIIGANTAYYTRSNGSQTFLRQLVLTGAAIGSSTENLIPIGSSTGFSGQLVGLTQNPGGTNLWAATTEAVDAGHTVPKLVAFDPAAPGVLTINQPIGTAVIPPATGLLVGEKILAMATAVSSGTTYVLARSATQDASSKYTGRLYTLSVGSTVTANPVGTGDLMTGPTTKYELQGNFFGMSVDPKSGNLRITSDVGTTSPTPPAGTAGENLQVNPSTGATTKLADLNQRPFPVINAGAHSSNFAGSTSSSFYAYNAGASPDQFMSVDASGLLTTRFVFSSSIDNGASDKTAFDIIGGHDGIAWLSVNSCDTSPLCSSGSGNPAFSTLFHVDLTTGAVIPAASGLTVGRNDTSSPNGTDTRIQLRAMTLRFP